MGDKRVCLFCIMEGRNLVFYSCKLENGHSDETTDIGKHRHNSVFQPLSTELSFSDGAPESSPVLFLSQWCKKKNYISDKV